MPALSSAQRKKLVFRLGLAGLIAVAIGLFLLKGVHILALIDRVVTFVAALLLPFPGRRRRKENR